MSLTRVRPDRTLDCIGLHCPEPVLRTRIELDRMAPGTLLEVLADDPDAEKDIKRLVTRLGHEILSLKSEDGRVRFLIRRR